MTLQLQLVFRKSNFLHICLVTAGTAPQIGGLEKHFIELATNLAREHRVTVIANLDHASLLPAAVNFIPFDFTRSRVNPFNLYRLYRCIKDNDFDVIHTQANKATSLMASLKPFVAFKLVATLHGSKKNLRSYERADHVIAVSNRIAENLTNPNVTVVYNGVQVEADGDQDQDLRGELGLSTELPLVCAVGRLVAPKGFDLLLEAFVDVPAQLVVVGEGEERRALERQVEKLGLGERVCLVGRRSDVPRFLRAADLVVISSRREGFSYVMAEALLQRTPLVSFDVADVKRIIGSRYVVPVGDVPALHAAICSCLADHGAVMADFRQAFELAARDFTLSAMVEKTLAVYRRVLAGAPLK